MLPSKHAFLLSYALHGETNCVDCLPPRILAPPRASGNSGAAAADFSVRPLHWLQDRRAVLSVRQAMALPIQGDPYMIWKFFVRSSLPCARQRPSGAGHLIEVMGPRLMRFRFIPLISAWYLQYCLMAAAEFPPAKEVRQPQRRPQLQLLHPLLHQRLLRPPAEQTSQP